jgi:hypothetical protein
MARRAVEIVVDGTPEGAPVHVSMAADLVVRASSRG